MKRSMRIVMILMVTQVLEYRFPGHPAPPLGLMVKIALAVENWLQV